MFVHAEQCSNLMLIESIPREPLAFHLVPFDCPRVQYTLQVSQRGSASRLPDVV